MAMAPWLVPGSAMLILKRRIRPDHPLRVMRGLANGALTDVSSACDAFYATFGRQSIPPERLI